MNAKWHANWLLDITPDLPNPAKSWLTANWRAFVDPSIHADPLVRVQKSSTTAPIFTNVDGHKLTHLQRQLGGEQIDVTLSQHVVRLEHRHSGCDLRLTGTAPLTLLLWGEEPIGAVFAALSEAFARFGWMRMHASAVFWPQTGVAECFLGRSGSGKSCRLQAALRQGAQAISEDLVWINATTGLVCATTDECRLLPDAFDLMPWLPLDKTVPGVGDKRLFKYEDIDAGLAPPRALTKVTVLKHFEEDNDPLRRVQAIWESFNLPLTSPARAHLERLVNKLVTI